MLKSLLQDLFVFACAMGLIVAQVFDSPNVSALSAGDIVIKVKPAEQEIELAPGQSRSGTITVQNVGRLGFTFSLLSNPYQVVNENYDPDFVTENSYTKLKNWITFPENDIHLEPGEEREVRFDINVPRNIPGGGQYAAIIVQTHDSVDENSTLQVVSRVAALVYAHVSGEEHIGGVLMQHRLPGFVLGSPLSASATVKNDGNVDFRVTQTLTIYDFFTGTPVMTSESVTEDNKTPGYANPVVLPATSRTSKLTWEGAPQLGVFRAIQTIKFLEQEYTYEQLVFICPLWLAGIVVFFIVLMLLWLILRIRKRKRNRPQAF